MAPDIQVDMPVDHPHLRFGLGAGVYKEEPILVPRAGLGCDTLYTYPKTTDKVDVTNPVTFKWDTKCQINSDTIDLQLFQTGGMNNLLKQYQNIQFSAGEYTANLSPRWWNDSQSATLYVNILKSGGMSWDTSWPRGPDFNVTYDFSKFYTVTTDNGVAYTRPIVAAQSTEAIYEDARGAGGKGVSKAVIAVAVIIPIVVICLLGGAAFVFYRRREKKSLQRWSQALSQASNMEWEKGALPGERLSSHGRPSTHYSTTTDRASKYGRGRPSMSSTGRPASSVMMENMAGAGAGRPFPSHGEYVEGPTRSSIQLADGTTRQSRISFADGRVTRPSFSHERRHAPSGLAEASYATGSAIDDGSRHSPTVDPAMTRGSMDELRDMEAVMLMRRSGYMPEQHGDNGNDVEALDHAGDAARNAASPPPGSIPTVAYGPDQMLAVYAQRGKVNASPVNTPAPPPAAVTKSTSRPNPMKRLLSRKDVRSKTPTGPPPVPDLPVSPNEPVSMRNYTHLNQGTMSAAAMDQLPPPGPPRSASALSDNNDHFEDAYEDHHPYAR